MGVQTKDIIMYVKNKKNKKLYTVLNTNIINCTNEQDGQKMVLYTGSDKEGCLQIFVREINEFFEKFETM